jgi:hypothetical protein
MPHHQGREHGYQSSHDHRYTCPLRAHEGPLPEVWQGGSAEAHPDSHRTHRRYKAVASLEITYGDYQALCDCCTTFCNTPAGVLCMICRSPSPRSPPTTYS